MQESNELFRQLVEAVTAKEPGDIRSILDELYPEPKAEHIPTIQEMVDVSGVDGYFFDWVFSAGGWFYNMNAV